MQEEMKELAALQHELADLDNKGNEFEEAADIMEAKTEQAEDKYTAVKDVITDYKVNVNL